VPPALAHATSVGRSRSGIARFKAFGIRCILANTESEKGGGIAYEEKGRLKLTARRSRRQLGPLDDGTAICATRETAAAAARAVGSLP
jgi:hypothetical protein